jgi:polysaccharide deacetylase family protein (PEP-CTERM system associated)
MISSITGMREIQNAMSVDVEEYFHVSAFEKHISRNDWGDLPSRIERNINQILSLFNDYNVKATFFILGWIAERYPELVRKIAEMDHEISSHGYSHVRIFNQDPGEFREDITRTKGPRAIP